MELGLALTQRKFQTKCNGLNHRPLTQRPLWLTEFVHGTGKGKTYWGIVFPKKESPDSHRAAACHRRHTLTPPPPPPLAVHCRRADPAAGTHRSRFPLASIHSCADDILGRGWPRWPVHQQAVIFSGTGLRRPSSDILVRPVSPPQRLPCSVAIGSSRC